MKDIIKVLLLLSVAVMGLFACNRYEDDVVQPRSTGQIILNADTYTTHKNQKIRLNVLANDSVGTDGTLTFGIPAHGAVFADSAGFLYQPNQNYQGSDRFFYKFCAGTTCDSALVTINVVDTTAICPIKANRDFFPALSGKAEIIAVLVNDNTCGAVTVSIPGSPTHGTATVLPNNTLSYTSTLGFVGQDSLTYEFLTPDGRTANAKLLINVASNCTLTAVADNAHATAGQTIYINPLPNDILCNTPSSQISLTVNNKATSKGYAQVQPGNQISYLPFSNFAGRDTVEYQICNAGKCSVGYIYVTVQAAIICNSANFIANPDTVYVPAGSTQTSFIINMLQNDVYCQNQIYSTAITTNGNNGYASPNQVNNVHYIVYNKSNPPANPVYTDEFRYEITAFINGSIERRNAKVVIHFR